MPIVTTYTNARASLAHYCNEATANHELVIISRRGAQNVALVALDELEGLLETAHLLRSPHNAKRLLKAIARTKKKILKSRSMESLKKEMGL